MKKYTFYLLLVLLFLCLDYQGYYYGIGKKTFYGLTSSFLNKEIPNRFDLKLKDYSFSGKEYISNKIGVSLYEIEMRTSVIEPGKFVFCNNDKKEIFIKEILGYWYNKNMMVFKVQNNNDKISYIEVYEEKSNKLFKNIIYENKKYTDNLLNTSNMILSNYIDVNQSKWFFIFLKITRFISLLLLIVVGLYFSINSFKKRSI